MASRRLLDFTLAVRVCLKFSSLVFKACRTICSKLSVQSSAKGRYVRLYSKGNTTNKLNHYIEVEVFGKPAA